MCATDGPARPDQTRPDQKEKKTRRRRQRSDARQSVTAILQAATEALNADPRASVEDIARAAGVTRQTVYAHFPTRDALLDAVIARAMAELTEAFDAAGPDAAGFDDERPDHEPPSVALIRLLETGWQVAARYPVAWHLPQVSAEQDAARHAPVLSRLHELIRRGQEAGELDATASPEWLLTAALAVGRAAEEEVRSGRMTVEEATQAVRHSFYRLLGVKSDG